MSPRIARPHLEMPEHTRSYLGDDEAQLLLSNLDDNIEWQREQFRIFGKQVPAPRLSAWFGDEGRNYRYTGIDHMAAGWPRELYELRDGLHRDLGMKFNFVVVNRYQSGDEHMGWHRDDEQGTDPIIASLSVGAERRFRVELSPSERAGFDLGAGDLLVFDGRQRHQLSKTRKPSSVRINLTFRKLH
jgi:alkylated DNA repair dioxygenase AlkB